MREGQTLLEIKSFNSVTGHFFGVVTTTRQNQETSLEAGASPGRGAAEVDPTASNLKLDKAEPSKGLGPTWNSSSKVRAEAKCNSGGGDMSSTGSNAAADAGCSMQRSMGEDAG